MNAIAGFLQKFLKLDGENKSRIAAILETIKMIAKIELTPEQIEIKGDNLRLNCNPVLRNEIFMHRLQIEESLKQQKIFLRIV